MIHLITRSPQRKPDRRQRSGAARKAMYQNHPRRSGANFGGSGKKRGKRIAEHQPIMPLRWEDARVTPFSCASWLRRIGIGNTLGPLLTRTTGKLFIAVAKSVKHLFIHLFQIQKCVMGA